MEHSIYLRLNWLLELMALEQRMAKVTFQALTFYDQWKESNFISYDYGVILMKPKEKVTWWNKGSSLSIAKSIFTLS